MVTRYRSIAPSRVTTSIAWPSRHAHTGGLRAMTVDTLNGSAPELSAHEQEGALAPIGPMPALDIASAVEHEDITRTQRVYVDVPGVPRVPLPYGGIATVQRERRADGSLGEYLLAAITPPKTKGAPESAQRWSIAAVQAAKLALESAGVLTLR